MKYCKQCLTTDIRPNAFFSDNGICIACSHTNEMQNSSYVSNLDYLQKLVKHVKSKRNRKYTSYDCIVGVSGGKDSTRQAHWVRDRLGLEPLLVCCGYPPLQMTDIGASNLSNLIKMGFDLEVFIPSPKSSAKLSLESFLNFGNVCKSTEIALFSTVPKFAIAKKIPIIFWGENPALQEGDSATAGKNYFDANNLRYLNTLQQGGTDWISASVGDSASAAYQYPDELSFNKSKVDMFYLGPAWDDWSMDSNSAYAALNGLSLRPHDVYDTGDISGASMLDEEFTNINMMIKYYKFGFGRASDICNERIRDGLVTRDEAIAIVEEFDGVCSDRIISRYCDYVGINTKAFWKTVNSYVNRELFIVSEESRPVKKFRVGYNLES